MSQWCDSSLEISQNLQISPAPLGGWGGGTQSMRKLGSRVLRILEKDRLENLVQETREPQVMKSKDRRPVCPESKPTSDDICHFMVTRPPSFLGYNRPPSPLLGRADKEGFPRAGPACVLSRPRRDAVGPGSKDGAGVPPGFPKAGTTGRKPGG